MIRIIFLIGLFIGIIWIGIRRTGERLANDIAHTIEKAHIGILPAGIYAEQYVSVDRFSRNALRVPFSDDILDQIDSCTSINTYDVSCRIVQIKAAVRKIDVILSVSARFDGNLKNGEHIQVIPHEVLVSATIILNNHKWCLSSITPIKYRKK